MLEKEQRKILLRFYWMGINSIIWTPTTLTLTANITKNLSDNIRIIINLAIYILGYYFIPMQSMWIADIKDIIENSIDYKKFKKIKRRITCY